MNKLVALLAALSLAAMVLSIAKGGLKASDSPPEPPSSDE